MAETHYSILGIPDTSTKDEIKKAYRKLSLKYHPDKVNGDKNTFQKINDAYHTLYDDVKRKHYDEILNSKQNHPSKKTAPHNGNANAQHTHQSAQFVNGMNIPENMVHIFEMLQKNGNIQFKVNTNQQKQNSHTQSHPQKPSNIEFLLEITLEESFMGTEKPVDITRTVIEDNEKSKERETIYVRVERGVDTNEVLYLRGRGHRIGKKRGDIRIIFKVKPHEIWERNGLDLIYKKDLTLKEALCGFQLSVKYLNGQTIDLTNNTIINSMNSAKVVNGLGMQRGSGERAMKGRLIIHFNVKLPSVLSEKQKEVLLEYF